MARKHTSLMVFAFLSFAVLAYADQPALNEAASRNGYSPADIAAIQKPIDQAASAGIPLEPVVKKAFEGVAKRAPAAAIVRVLSEQVERAKAVQQALPPARRGDARVLQAALTASAAGADAAAIENIGASAGDHSEAAFYVLGVLVSAGVAPPQAASFVRAQVDAGLRPAEMESLSVAGARAVKAGLATGEDLGAVTAADLRNGGQSVWNDRLRGVRADTRVMAPQPAHESITKRQAERNAETKTVRERESTPTTVAPVVPQPTNGDTTGGAHQDQIDHGTDHKDQTTTTQSHR